MGDSMIECIADVSEEFLARHNLPKGSHNFRNDLDDFVADLIAHHEVEYASGGSAANVVHGYTNLGGTASFCCTLNSGMEQFVREFDEIGAECTYVHRFHKPANFVYVLNTPDNERTFMMRDDVHIDLSSNELAHDAIRHADYFHQVGFNFVKIPEVAFSAMRMAMIHNLLISFDMSAPFVAKEHRDHVERALYFADLVFVTDEESAAFGYSGDDLADYVFSLHEKGKKKLLYKMGEKGAIVYEGSEKTFIPPFETKVVGSSGAGDGFAAGVLYGLSKGNDVVTSARMGAYYAAQCLRYAGSRCKGKVLNLESMSSIF